MGCTHSLIDPASRFRFLQYVPYLEEAGWQISHRPNFPSRYWRSTARLRLWRSLQGKGARWLRRASRWKDIRDAANFDAVFLNRDLHAGESWWEEQLLRRNRHLLFDFDDAIYLGAERQKHIEWICRHAAWVTTGNEHLAQFARRVTDRVTVLPSVVEVSRYEIAPPQNSERTVRVGWLGSDLSIRETLLPYLDMFSRLQRELGFEFVIVTKPRPQLPEGIIPWRYVEWSPEVEEKIGRHLDIGLMPLVDNEFQRGKCGMKLLQYMAGGIPAVVSPIGVNREIVRPGVTGFLAHSEEEWREALSVLIASSRLRREMGLGGREFCERHYSLQVWLPTLLEILDRVATA